MLSTSEKIRFLRAVSLFATITDDLLAEVADLLEEVDFKAGAPIFHEGDQGAAMYIIVDGRVHVHRGGRTLNTLEKYAVFGEMSALDPEPRSASVTAVENTRLLQLEQAAVHRLMAAQPGIASGIIRILCQHLRARLADMVDDYHYLQQVARLTEAAAAVEASIYEPEVLEEVTHRTDALGQLARIFQRMIREVYAREQHLQRQVQELRIEVDKARQAHQVAQITTTDYFQQLRSKAHDLRNLLERQEE
jgi:CRP/FNR family cyclic AMP-dependent transcriptional regulator